MKKFFQSKGFIVSSLALLCVTILGVCWFVSRDRTGDFRPDESPPSSVTGDWSDGGTQTDGDNGADAYAPGQSTDAEEEYRVIDGKAGFHITTPKTESGTRIIPILYPEVAEQLRLQIETIDALYPDDQLVLGGVHGFVFRNRTGSFMSAHNINRAIERISVTYNMEEMDQAELEDREPDLLPHFSVHNLRHTFCTRLCESTNDVKFIQQVMGHADFSTTMDIYTHITQENMQEKAKNISVNMKLM